MAMSKTGYEHIVYDDDKNPVIVGTTMKVIELIAERKAYGWSPEELHFQHPYLTLGQIYSALAYYSDHSAQLDQDLEVRLQAIDEVHRTTAPSPLKAKLTSKSN